MAGESALLPAGLADELPPGADQEARAVERLMGAFGGHGYLRVKPPLLEFEDSLLSGTGAALARDTFRLMDPISQRMLALRADMTPQVARIAAHRLAGEARPLRLCYAGQVLRVRGTLLRPERQFGQVGAELIGSATPASDVEAILLAAEALHDLGLTDLTVDLSLPTLVAILAKSLGFDASTLTALRAALDGKDVAAVREVAGAKALPFEALMRAAGPASEGLLQLKVLDLPAEGRAEVQRLGQVVEDLVAVAPWLGITVDPVEYRGYEYQTGLSFTLFAAGARAELGRGGRYEAERADGRHEPATGFSLFMDTILKALPAQAAPPRVFIPFGVPRAKTVQLRQEGKVLVRALEASSDDLAQARRQACDFIWRDGKLMPVTKEKKT